MMKQGLYMAGMRHPLSKTNFLKTLPLRRQLINEEGWSPWPVLPNIQLRLMSAINDKVIPWQHIGFTD
jgi:hypothetical protein